MRYLLATTIIVCSWAGTAPADDARLEALQKFNDFIGEWKGNGGPDKPKVDPRDPVWKESIRWSWKFQGDDSWLTFNVKDGKHIKWGEVRYRPATSDYELTLSDLKDQKTTFTGRRDDKGYFTFERTDPGSGETQQVVMNTAAEGVRFVYRYAVKPKGRTVYTKVWQVQAGKEGEALGAKQGSGNKGPECIVTGGLGTITVSYKGQTYYVCCTGCKDAFESNPEKYIKK
ncbi:MAG: YHS domain-containing protein [Gemmataceae bacterium]|nr:YHS domain-containing protein [Gemmataceae bacterium]